MFFHRVFDALHVALTTHALYFYLIDMFGDLAGAMVHSVWYVSGQRDKVGPAENTLQELQGNSVVIPTVDRKYQCL